MQKSPSSNGNMPNSSKKRKASELEQDSTKPKGGSSRTRTKEKSRPSTSVEEAVFTTECPASESTKCDGGAHNGTQLLAPGFSVDYAVRPGPKWTQMRSYRNVKYVGNTFATGAIVYINRMHPPPKPPPSKATDAEVLAYDRANFWVAKIADARAANDQEVWLRVFWLYWPEELPMGRQPYHSDHELIMSNAMDIIDAQTIACAAEVTHWDENDVDAQFDERFWRQTFDVGQLGKDRRGGLSVLKKHCACREAFNPDRVMYQCKDTECGVWNHQQCLIDDVYERARHEAANGTLSRLNDIETKVMKTEDSPGRLLKLQRYDQSDRKSASNPELADHKASETNGTVTVAAPERRGRPTKPIASTPPSKQQEKQIKVSIIDGDGDEDGPLLAEVMEATKKGKKEDVIPGRTWIVRVNCLRCRTPM